MTEHFSKGIDPFLWRILKSRLIVPVWIVGLFLGTTVESLRVYGFPLHWNAGFFCVQMLIFVSSALLVMYVGYYRRWPVPKALLVVFAMQVVYGMRCVPRADELWSIHSAAILAGLSGIKLYALTWMLRSRPILGTERG